MGYAFDGYSLILSPVNRGVRLASANLVSPALAVTQYIPLRLIETEKWYDSPAHNFLLLEAGATWGATSLSFRDEFVMGSAHFPIMTGVSFQGNKDNLGFKIKVGYQLNYIDLYGFNSEFTRREKRFGTGIIELGFGIMDDWKVVSAELYSRYGYNPNGAHSLNIGCRFSRLL